LARREIAKRILDLIVGAALLALLSPLILILLIGLAVDMIVCRRDRGGFLYREPRISRGRVFGLLKFRTLRRDVLDQMQAADAHARLYEADPANLTWAGRRLLKPWYLDELPQLLNVLRGDISLVGPRPWPPEMVRRQVAEGRDYRNRVLAGLTGPAQVTKGEGIPYEDLDSLYLERSATLSSWGLVRYDLQILWRTVEVIARGKGLNY
jgi:lipopolysaccharide/colanic/teichoic acid biosynthesis glycosyltransferase